MDLLKNKTLGSFSLSKVRWSRWQDSFKKQEFYETVHRTVSPKFVALCSRQIWIIPPQVRAFSILNNKKEMPNERHLFLWSRWQDSNLRHPAPKAGTLAKLSYTSLFFQRFDILIYYSWFVKSYFAFFEKTFKYSTRQ